MPKFNLLDEPWIQVMSDHEGKTELVSLKELFANAEQYLQLAGDTLTQDFAVFRLLLAVVHTVFSRFDGEGNPYPYLALNERFAQTEDIDEDDLEDYVEGLSQTWDTLWQKGSFPRIVIDYLEKWHDRFYLFDEQYPFYQVRAEDIAPGKISKEQPSPLLGKNLNRVISESGNKTALFSPKIEKNKEILSADEIARWLITLHGYIGLSDKVIFGREKYKASKGWLFDIGGIQLSSSNLFEALILNTVFPYRGNKNNFRQSPAWESDSAHLIQRYLSGNRVNNVAELYTNWSRAVYIDPEIDLSKPFSLNMVKLPEVEHKDQFLEPMSLWRFNSSGENKDHFTPKKHPANQAFWRSFGLLALPSTLSTDSTQHIQPGVIRNLQEKLPIIGNKSICIHAISMKDDGNATSWVPVDEIIDQLRINDYILTDIDENGWVPRIHETIELTKYSIAQVYKKFLLNLNRIRNVSNDDSVNQRVEKAFYLVDQPFRSWLLSLQTNQDKASQISNWKNLCKKLLLAEASVIVSTASNRDFMGIQDEKNTVNIATIYSDFVRNLNNTLF